MHREQDFREPAAASERITPARKPFSPPRLTLLDPAIGPTAGLAARRRFVPPQVSAHETLPVITAGSVNLWQ